VSRQLDKNKVRRSFERAAQSYDKAAVVQQRTADELVDRLEVLKISPHRILDAGCGTGYALPGLMRRYPDAEFIMLDISPSMLGRQPLTDRGKIFPICGDVESTPLASHSVDMVFCNAVLEWCELEVVLSEYLRVLKPEGLLTFATFGPDTLAELVALWREIDDVLHVHRFTDMHDIGDALVSHQFAMPVMDVDYVTVTHRNLVDAFSDLKQLGAGNALAERHPGLTGKMKFDQLERISQAFRNDNGLLQCTCEIVYGHAWAPMQIELRDDSGGVVVPLERLRKSEGGP